jgi:hypothetical protein
MTRIRSVLSSLAGAAIVGTLAFGISSAAAQPAAPAAASDDYFCTFPPPDGSPLRACKCEDGRNGYCAYGSCDCGG